MTPKYQCDNCDWFGTEDELDSLCVDFGSRYQPPEYECSCPACGDPWENMKEVPYCASCGDVFVKDEGDNCAECIEAMREDHYDGLREECLLGGE